MSLILHNPPASFPVTPHAPVMLLAYSHALPPQVNTLVALSMDREASHV